MTAEVDERLVFRLVGKAMSQLGDVVEFPGYALPNCAIRCIRVARKPLLGPHFVPGDAWVVVLDWYVLQGAVLASIYREQLAQFASTYLGFSRKSGFVTSFLQQQLAKIGPALDDGMDSFSYVQSRIAELFGHSGDPSDFAIQIYPQKIPLQEAVECAWMLAAEGAAIGGYRPDSVKQLYRSASSHFSLEETRSLIDADFRAWRIELFGAAGWPED